MLYKLKNTFRFLFILCSFALSYDEALYAKQAVKSSDYPTLSLKLIETAYQNKPETFDSLLQILANAKFDVLTNQLYSDTRKKTFWLNVHNAFVYTLLKKDPTLLKNHHQFLDTKRILVAGVMFSLNEIEHGILRRSDYRNKVTDQIKQLRVLEMDYRVHFGLNFGAKDCPVVPVFNEYDLNSQLKDLEKKYIVESTTVDSVKKEIITSELFEWYKNDFGGKEGLRSLLQKNGIEQAKDWKLTFRPFNWDVRITE